MYAEVGVGTEGGAEEPSVQEQLQTARDRIVELERDNAKSQAAQSKLHNLDVSLQSLNLQKGALQTQCANQRTLLEKMNAAGRVIIGERDKARRQVAVLRRHMPGEVMAPALLEACQALERIAAAAAQRQEPSD